MKSQKEVQYSRLLKGFNVKISRCVYKEDKNYNDTNIKWNAVGGLSRFEKRVKLE